MEKSPAVVNWEAVNSGTVVNAGKHRQAAGKQ